NGTYEVYNNTTNNIQANYNFWNSQDSNFIASRIYDKYDNSAKGIVYHNFPASTGLNLTNETNLWGRVYYDNSVFTSIKNSPVKISSLAGDSLTTLTTNLGGYFWNMNMPNGTYITSTKTTASWGGVNATDALMIMRHFALIQPLVGLRKIAADVNASGTVNSTDAMLVMQRYTQLINSFASGNWYFEKDTVAIAGSSAESNLKGICFGDVNGSYMPTGAKSALGSDLALIWEGSVFAASNDHLILPVKVKRPLQTGAISLGFYFPEEYLEIAGVALGNGNTNITYSFENGLFRLAWGQIDPYILDQDEILVDLFITTKDLSGLTAPIALQLFEDVELADGSARPLVGVTLSMPLIESLLTGTKEETLTEPMVNIYPNPVVSDAIVSMVLPGQGSYDIRVYDVVGKLRESVANEYRTPGKCLVKLGCSKFPSGVYLAKIRVSSGGKVHWFSEKIVVSNNR
ncbi:MAG: dockerin type I domain-containing protein, partial [Bacteroidota bacterium]